MGRWLLLLFDCLSLELTPLYNPQLPGSQQVKPCTRCCYCRDQPCCWWGKSALSVPHFSRRHNNLVITPGQPSGLATALLLISTGLTLLETPPLWYDIAMSLPAEEAFVTLFNRLGEGNLDLLDVPSDDGDIEAIGCGRTGQGRGGLPPGCWQRMCRSYPRWLVADGWWDSAPCTGTVGVVDFGHTGSDLQGSHFDLDVSSVTLENDWLLQEGSW